MQNLEHNRSETKELTERKIGKKQNRLLYLHKYKHVCAIYLPTKL